ncbi:hypothetical protein NPX13_g7077 [Xylaria arbuscula]|uniref:GP-PDE domain-containing protein n=1 Tax=Xylaria arbuscula TaxID=114810 RepID=A0A9W8NB08_9PEZI|nr:hypothetical protein NPX13_g7077 [Xylaria arbuscula]
MRGLTRSATPIPIPQVLGEATPRMRFGRDYYRRFVPEWTGFYVRYDLIKSHLKSRAESFDSSLQLLSDDIGAFISFHQDRITVLACQEAGLWALFDKPDVSWTFHPHERDFLVSGLESLVQEALRLNWFDRVNQEAIDRLFGKLRHTVPEDGSSIEELAARRARWEEKRQAQQLELSKIRARLRSSIALMGTMRVHHEYTRTALISVVGELSLNVTNFRLGLVNAINGDKPGAVEMMFWRLTKQSDAVFRETSELLLNFFIVQQSWRNVLYLLEHIANTPDKLKISQDSIRLLVTVHAQETHKSKSGTSVTSGSDRGVGEEPSALDVLVRMLEVSELANLKELFINNAEGQQSPLHLLAKHGLLEWCRLILRKIEETGEKSDVRDAILLRDNLQLTPLHYALIYQHSHVTNLFSEILRANEDEFQRPERREILGSYLNMAVALGNGDLVAQVSHLTNLDGKSMYGISALHLAARDGRVDIISHLLRAGASIDVDEHPRGWTPLFEAAVNDRSEAVQYLRDHGAKTDVIDCIGWTVKELTTYRGHLAIAELLNTTGPGDNPSNITHGSRRTTYSVKRGLTDPGKIVVSVNLGPMQVGRNEPPVRLSYFSEERERATESLYNLRVSGASQTHSIRLPILDDRSNAPLLFTFPQDAVLQLAFKIFRDDAEKGEDGVLVCGGTALLESNKLLFGSSRQSLVREHTVSVLDSATLDIVGSILFTYVIAKPFAHLQSPKYSIAELCNGDNSVTVIGHRGLGQNVNSQDFLQIGENTVESFTAAGNAGASFVEVSYVQVTKDLQPIIYHDFSLSETGTDSPIHDVTVDQYKHTSSIQASQPVPDMDIEESGIYSMHAGTRPRSQSLVSSDGPGDEVEYPGTSYPTPPSHIGRPIPQGARDGRVQHRDQIPQVSRDSGSRRRPHRARA